MGAHRAPAHVARQRPAHASSAPQGARWGRLAGHGVLTASAALALTGAGAGAALAQDSSSTGGLLAASDTSVLCGILGGDRCSTDGESTSGDTSASTLDRFDDGTDTDAGSLRSDAVPQRTSDTRSSGADATSDGTTATRPSSARSTDDGTRSTSAQASQLDTPPPPGQVRTINLPD